MTTITIPKKEYNELYRLKEKIDRLLTFDLGVEKRQMTGKDLLKFSKLKIRGGPKDLSNRIDYYLYGTN
jgi:hypothetical protein